MLRKLMVLAFSLALLAPLIPAPTAAQNQGKPFDMPVAAPAGPSTWLLGQPYGNTTGAYNRGALWYEAGQRLHFGIDIGMPCGTPLVAVADAEVVGVDDLGFGSGPHNLILRHADAGLTTLYGHLLERPPLVNGQFVMRGQEVALSGDPDVTCDSRPHLHFEVRSLDYRTAYNPVEYVNAAWHSLSNIGSFSSQMFERDLDNPRRWLTLLDQPPVAFGGWALNDYAAAYPPEVQPPPNPPMTRNFGALPADAAFRQRRLGYEGCCFWAWWHPTDSSRLYTIDGSEGQRANVFEWIVGAGETFNVLAPAPPPFASPDGSYQVWQVEQQAAIRRASDGAEWLVNTGGALPAISPDNTRLLWLRREGVSIPGQEPPPTRVFVSDMDGGNARQIVEQRGGNAVWLDTSRILLTTSERQVSTLTVYDVSDDSTFTLGAWEWLRGLSIAPGGGRVMFYLSYYPDSMVNGVYVLDLQPGAAPVKLPWFGAWRWRDADSAYYIPFDPTTNTHSLRYYHVPTGEDRPLTDPAGAPFTVANGDWSVSADGRRVLFLNAADLTMWVWEQE